MAAGAKRAQVGVEAAVLAERLDERADRVLHHRPHLVVDLRVARRREALVEPRLVVLERELRLADQEVRRAEARERRQPGAGAVEVALERRDVGRLRPDHAPAEDADALVVRHGKL